MNIRLCSNFCSTKQVLNSSQLLAYVYNPNLTIIIAGDASAYGKQVLNSSQLLAYVYDPNLTITLTGDGSAYGIGSADITCSV